MLQPDRAATCKRLHVPGRHLSVFRNRPGPHQVQWVLPFDGGAGAIEELQIVEVLPRQPHSPHCHLVGRQRACAHPPPPRIIPASASSDRHACYMHVSG